MNFNKVLWDMPVEMPFDKAGQVSEEWLGVRRVWVAWLKNVQDWPVRVIFGGVIFGLFERIKGIFFAVILWVESASVLVSEECQCFGEWRVLLLLWVKSEEWRVQVLLWVESAIILMSGEWYCSYEWRLPVFWLVENAGVAVSGDSQQINAIQEFLLFD